MSKKRLEINNIRGVDYTSPQMTVDNYRATEISNIIFKNGIDQRRSPYEQVATAPSDTLYYDPDNIFPDESYVSVSDGTKLNPSTIHWIWTFFGEDNSKHVIAHIGHLLYEVENIGNNFDFKHATFTCLSQTHLLLNELVGAAISNRLYIFSGVRFLFVYIDNYVTKVDYVEDHEKTYIPVTTIGIVYPDSPVAGSRQTLDLVSRNTQWRRNKCISGTYIDDGETVRKETYFTFTLDRSIVAKDEKDLNNIVIKINKLVKTEEVE